MTNRTSRWSRLAPWQRAGVLAALVLPCCAGVALIGFYADDEPAATFRNGQPVGPPPESPAPGQEPDATFRAARPQLQTRSSAVVERRAITITEPIAFRTSRVLDATLPRGVRQERVPGVAGERRLTYEITVVNGREVARRLLAATVVRPPVARVLAVGTYADPAATCAPGYTPCVPVAADVDCVGTGDDGPQFVAGPVRVTGSDPYDLDHDGDGTGCG